jgi:hypothetical protein
VTELAEAMSKRTTFAGMPELSALRERIANPKLGYRERAASLVKSAMNLGEVKSMPQRIESNLRLLTDHIPQPHEKQ